MMNFELTEAEVVRLTGYSRMHLRNLREGRKRTVSGKEYADEPVLQQGTDWQRYGRAVLYTHGVASKLQQRKNKEW